ncbi:hypothetical protein HNP02_004063 [Mycobacterium sp. AZCC_0083]|nr:hypothetical protein [Mycobacterium sp. AZCC_0083]
MANQPHAFADTVRPWTLLRVCERLASSWERRTNETFELALTVIDGEIATITMRTDESNCLCALHDPS